MSSGLLHSPHGVDDKEAGCDYAKPLFNSQRSFLVRFEVDDPDDPFNNPR